MQEHASRPARIFGGNTEEKPATASARDADGPLVRVPDGPPPWLAADPAPEADHMPRDPETGFSLAMPGTPEHIVGRPAAEGLAGLSRRLDEEIDGFLSAIALPWRSATIGLGGGLAPGQMTVLAGPPGVSKSYMALNILLAAEQAGVRWRLLPLEDDATTWTMKSLAVAEADWRLVAQMPGDDEDTRRDLGRLKLDGVGRHARLAAHLLHERIAENPRVPLTTPLGTVVPDVPWASVIDFVEREGEAGTGLVVIDPISMINFGNGNEFRGQEAFYSRLVGAAASSRVHVLLVAHTVKQARHLGVAETLEGIQGSAMLTRLAHNVLVLSRHETRDSVLVDGATARHRLTLSLPKCRNGFSCTRYAFDLEAKGPVFREWGNIQN